LCFKGPANLPLQYMSDRFLFLAAQLQPFLVSGLRSLLAKEGTQVLLLFDRANEEAPLEPEYHPGLKVFSYRHEPDPVFWDQIAAFRPDVVFCAGWMHTRYLGWSRELYRSGTRTICAMDTQWQGSLKQRLWCLGATLLLRKCFSDAWVPGMRQAVYARKLGFAEDRIHDGLYAPDTELFIQAYDHFRGRNNAGFPKTFLYAGRLVPHKLLPLLVAFCSLTEAERQGWQLLISGNGPMEAHPLLQHPAVRRYSFLGQPALARLMSEGGVCCLCSSKEPWGTIVQEAACAGMPLVVSTQSGGQPHFLEEGINGFTCDGTDNNSIRKALLKVIGSSPEALFALSDASHQKGRVPGSADWARVLQEIAHK